MRKEGFYKCKYNGEWVVAFYAPQHKFYIMCGDETLYVEVEFDEIGDKIELPE